MTVDKSRPEEILTDSAYTYAKKNNDWNDSWRTAGEFIWRMADAESIELDSAEDVISLALYWQRLVKMQRAFNGEFLTEGELNYEGTADSHEDEIPYAAMHRAILEEK